LDSRADRGSASWASTATPAPRIALYSPDSYGLGHYRRTRRIAQALVAAIPEAAVLVLSGSPVADRFSPVPRTDIVRLPALTKSETGGYLSRSLGVSGREVIRLRSAIIASALQTFKPDIFIADHRPAGIEGELRAGLEIMQRTRRPSLIALGLRDIIDVPTTVRRQWLRDGSYELLDSAYDEVWVYGKQEVFDSIAKYGVPPRAGAKFQFVGYVSDPPPAARPVRRGIPHVVATGGGGEDAYALMSAAITAHQISHRRFQLTIFPGPLMSGAQRRELESAAADIGKDVTVNHFTERAPAVVAGADCVISMGGYNSIIETLAAGVRCVVVPRVKPRKEQLLRAERMARLGWLDWIHPDDLEPRILLDRVLAACDASSGPRIPDGYLGGLENVVRRVSLALGRQPQIAASAAQ
jgi:predicted glycosyltransferase